MKNRLNNLSNFSLGNVGLGIGAAASTALPSLAASNAGFSSICTGVCGSCCGGCLGGVGLLAVAALYGRSKKKN